MKYSFTLVYTPFDVHHDRVRKSGEITNAIGPVDAIGLFLVAQEMVKLIPEFIDEFHEQLYGEDLSEGGTFTVFGNNGEWELEWDVTL